MSSSENGTSPPLAQKSKVIVLVKPGSDGISRGACPISQNVCMQVVLKSESNPISLDVITFTPSASSSFPFSITKLPTLIYKENILSHSDEITEYMDETFTEGPPLNMFDSKAHVAQADIFSKFCFVMKDQADPAVLEYELGKLEMFLRSNNHDFLISDHMSAMDTSLLPKLQHIRVAGYTVKNLSIPSEYKAVWGYLSRAYKTAAFRVTCPSNQEIIWHWVKDTSLIRDLFLLKPSYAFNDNTEAEADSETEQEHAQ